MNTLVTGGAGYIGSHAVAALRDAGHTPVVLDNLFQGHREAVPNDVVFAELDLRQTDEIEALLRKQHIDSVMHFAALATVADSMVDPLSFYSNNTAGTLSLLQAMDRVGIRRLVFSSTCATYGQPDEVPITEDAPQRPISPYGKSKLFVEGILLDYAAANDAFAFAAPRYFNVAGCRLDGSIGEDHDPESHIIPLLLQTALGQRPHFTIFGEDYDTPDGTCVRDYIHVDDLVGAHVAALEALRDGDRRFYNLGIGQGMSVKQIVDAALKVTGRDIEIRTGPRRPGDPPYLFANPEKIQRELGWKPKTTDVEEIVASAWRWFAANPDGYGS
ncbi:MAG: UDP-glucose 4-epimerase GalE [Phycisphaeraceae bacterium]|nr:UDP-glucose 4-epimerase GalE [Phycisphaeraceae bacterium]